VACNYLFDDSYAGWRTMLSVSDGWKAQEIVGMVHRHHEKIRRQS
jgi:hypothetical protein